MFHMPAGNQYGLVITQQFGSLGLQPIVAPGADGVQTAATQRVMQQQAGGTRNTVAGFNLSLNGALSTSRTGMRVVVHERHTGIPADELSLEINRLDAMSENNVRLPVLDAF